MQPVVFSSELITENCLEIINEGQQMILQGKWVDSKKLFEKYINEQPDDPAGYLFLAAVLNTEMTDREENLYGNRLIDICDSVESRALNWLENCSAADSALCYLYIGHSYAFKSIWESRFGSSISAMHYGLKAKKRYIEGLAVDSTLYDLYLGLGSYHYWKSVKAGFLRWLGLFRNEKEKGIIEIELAVDSSLFSSDGAVSGLIWIMINEKNYDSAIYLSQVMYEKYPEGNSFLWPLAESYFKLANFTSAAETYSLLLERLKSEPGNYFNIIEAAYYFYRASDKLGRKEDMRKITTYLENQYPNIPKDIRRRQKSKLARLLGRHHQSLLSVGN
jgi:hypothetical protein